MDEFPPEWHVPLILPPEDKPFDILNELYKKRPKFPFSLLNFKRPKEEFKEPDNLIKDLRNGWAKILENEARVRNPNFKADPNISQEFFDELANISDRLSLNAEDLSAVIYLESHFDPQAKSSTNKYHGLIQMDRTTFKSIFPNDSYEKYCKLPREKQLKYVEGYLRYRINEKHLTGQKISGGQLRTLIKHPTSINKQDTIQRQQNLINKTKEKAKQNTTHLNTRT